MSSSNTATTTVALQRLATRVPKQRRLYSHVQKLKLPAVGAGVELEGHGPHLVKIDRPVAPKRAISAATVSASWE